MKLLQENSYALVCFDREEFELSDITTVFAELDTLNCGAILDFRETLNDFSRTESLLIALKLQELDRLRFHKIGLIANGNGRGIRQIAQYARGRGLSVQTFDQLDAAASWIQD